MSKPIKWGRRPKTSKSEFYGTILAYAVVILLFGGVYAAYGEWAYGDWTCAFKNCRVLK